MHLVMHKGWMLASVLACAQCTAPFIEIVNLCIKDNYEELNLMMILLHMCGHKWDILSQPESALGPFFCCVCARSGLHC